MAYPVNTPRRIIIRANRDTLALIGGACALTLVIAYGVHGRPDNVAPPKAAPTVAHQEWTGHLADVQPVATPADAKPEPLSSDLLTVPKAQLALPVAPPKPKVKSCDSATPCTAKPAVPVPPVRRQVAAAPSLATPQKADNTLLHNLNPLNHMPDMAVVRRPFTYAGDTVVAWFKRF